MKRLLLALLFIFIVCLVATPTYASDAYQYKMTTDSKEWASMDHQQKLDVTQISEKELKDMDTDTLLAVVLDYPLMGDIFCFNSLEEGVEVVRSSFGGLDEFLNREDMGSTIIKQYKSQKTGIKKMFLDALLSSSSVFKNLTDDQQKEIANSIVESIERGEDTPFVDKNSEVAAAVIRATLVPETNLSITSAQESPLATKVINAYVVTPRGSRVAALIRGEELSPSQVTNLNNQVGAQYKTAVRLRNATTNYNCHSYALYSVSAANIYWISAPSHYFTDGSFTHIGSYPTAVNQRLYYPAPGSEHTAIINAFGPGNVINSSVKCTSKWGMAGLYSHSAIDCPYFTSVYIYKVYRP